MSLPPYSFASAFGHWTFDPAVAIALLAVVAGYLALMLVARRRGRPWPWWRAAAFVVLGAGSVVVCTMSSLATYDHTVLWAFATQLTLLISVVPVCISVGDPLGLVRAALSPAGVRRWDRLLAGPVVRVLTFPVVAAVLGVVVTMVVFLSGLLGAALRHTAVMDLLYLLLLVVGCLLALPLLGEELLPDWCTDPFRMLFAAVDGLLDAIPGIVVMTTGAVLAGGYYVHRARPAWTGSVHWDQHLAGALMLALTEVVSLPLLVILFFRWATHETRRDAAEAHPAATAPASDAPAPVAEPEVDRPWWETSTGPRRTDEYRPRR